MVTTTDFNHKIVLLGDEGHLRIANLGIREVLHFDIGKPNITSPTIGQNLAGATHTVTWTNSCRLGGTVEIFYSDDSGLTWTVCVKSGGGDGSAETDDGLFIWDVSGIGASTVCMLKVAMTDDISIGDVVAFFEIS